MSEKRRLPSQVRDRYCRVAPFGRDCFNCGRWLSNEDNLLREDKRPIYDENYKPVSVQTYMVYQCPDCGCLMRNPRVTIYD